MPGGVGRGSREASPYPDQINRTRQQSFQNGNKILSRAAFPRPVGRCEALRALHRWREMNFPDSYVSMGRVSLA